MGLCLSFNKGSKAIGAFVQISKKATPLGR